MKKKKTTIWKILQKIYYVLGMTYFLLLTSVIPYLISLGYVPTIGDYIETIMFFGGAIFFLWLLITGKYFIDCQTKL